MAHRNSLFGLLLFFFLVCGNQSFCQSGSISGQIKYAHKNASGNLLPLTLDSVIVGLYQNNQLIYSDTVDGTGHYSIANLAPGQYDIRLTCHKTTGGYSSSDAQAIVRHFVHFNNFALTGIFLKAAYVAGRTYINSTDAMLVARRFVGLITSFMIPDWVFESFSVTITANQNSVQNVYGLCAGDVNGTYTPYNSVSTTP